MLRISRLLCALVLLPSFQICLAQGTAQSFSLPPMVLPHGTTPAATLLPLPQPAEPSTMQWPAGGQTHTPAASRYYSGTLPTDTYSHVFAAVRHDGSAQVVLHDGTGWSMAHIPAAGSTSAVAVRPVRPAHDWANRWAPAAVHNEMMAAPFPHTAQATPAQPLSAPRELAIETDHALWQRLGHYTPRYVSDLVAFVSSVHQRTLGTRYSLRLLRMYPAASDPWRSVSDTGQINDLLQVWSDPALRQTRRDQVHLLRADMLPTAIAYPGVPDGGHTATAYGVTASLQPSPSANDPQFIWDAALLSYSLRSTQEPTARRTALLAMPTAGTPQAANTAGSRLSPLASRATSQVLILGKSGTGSGTVVSNPSAIQCGTTCVASFASGTSVQLTATAASGSTFAGWSGSCSGTNATCTVSMGTSHLVVANFDAGGFALTLAKAGSGKGSVLSNPALVWCQTDCTGSTVTVAAGTVLTLTATPATGSTFASWSGACSGTGTCTTTLSAARSVTATFSATVGGQWAQQVTTMFTGYFGRPPGIAGLAYYEEAMNSSKGNYLILVDDFFKSSESAALFAGMNTRSQVSQVFQNLFSRAPAAEGLNYWTTQVETGVISIAEMAYTVAYNATSSDLSALEAKRTAALAFAQALNSSQRVSAYGSSAGLLLGRNYLACVNSTAAANAAIARIESTMATLLAGQSAYSCPQ